MQQTQRVSGAQAVVEIEVLDGLVPFVLRELEASTLGMDVLDSETTSVRVLGSLDGLRGLDRLRAAVAAYLVEAFDVPRPKSLLGEQHLRRLVDAVEVVLASTSEPFTSFRFSAAGRESAVFQRLADELQDRLGLDHDPEHGELLMRVRPTQLQSSGWDVLLRTTPRPLSARSWRVQNYAGALNATIAAAMVELSEPKPTDRVFNPMCGSGTLLIERLAAGEPSRLVGCDFEPDALAATRANLGAARIRTRVELWPDDATVLTRVDETTFDRVLVDLPWGTLVGTHDDNASLYPAFLSELARVTIAGGRAVVLTHEIKLFERTLRDNADWEPMDEVRVFQKGHHPRAYVLRRTA